MLHRFAPTLSLLAVIGFLAWLGRPVGDPSTGSAMPRDDESADVVPRCAVPVTWRLAGVDPRFGVSPEWVTGAARDAAQVWGHVGGVPLLAEEAGALGRGAGEPEGDGRLGIRLVYDERQALLDADPPVRFEAAFYREVVSVTGAGPDRRFREIRVFAFRDRSDLVRILAHELGHALGLAHTPDDGAVMSAEQDGADPSSRPVALQPSDLSALEALCSTSVAASATR